MRAKITATVAVAMLASGLTTGSAFADANFRKWVSSFRTTAVQNGVSPSTFDRAFRGVDSPDPEVLRKARFQPEFNEPVWNYIDNRVNEHSVAVGQSMAKNGAHGSSASNSASRLIAISCWPSGRWKAITAKSSSATTL